jgi:hypothetical protein
VGDGEEAVPALGPGSLDTLDLFGLDWASVRARAEGSAMR